MDQISTRLPDMEAPLFLRGGGEMGRRIREYDWSTTSLGPVGTWPQSLRSAISICLNSNFPIAIYWGEDLTLLYNDAWSPIPGNKHPQSLGKTAREVWPDIWNAIESQFQKAFHGEPGGSKDALLPMQRHGYTEECYFDFTFTPVYGETGKVEGIFNAVIETTYRIISERRAAFLKNLALLIAEAKTEQQLLSAVVGFVETAAEDLPFAFLYAATANGPQLRGSSIPGYRPDTNLKQDWPFDAVRSRPFFIADISAHLDTVPGGFWPEKVQEACIIPLMGNNGTSTGYIVCGLSPRRRFDEEYHFFLESFGNAIFTALNNIVALEKERGKAQALAEIDRAKTAFFTNISHEFRTPLTLMLGSMESLLNEHSSELSDRSRTTVELGHRNAVRLLRLVNNLLDFSTLEAGKMQASFQATDISGFTINLAAHFHAAIEAAGLQLRVLCETVSQPVYIDREMWEKIVLNLLSNAYKYTLAGSVIISITETTDTVELKVADTGIGIPNAELPKMFQRFHRVENSAGRTIEGSGIGLSLVRELVQFHKGSIAVDSEEGKGTTFTVAIPKGTAHLNAEQIRDNSEDGGAVATGFSEELALFTNDISRAREEDVTSDGNSGHDIIVLVVEDNADMRGYITGVLRKHFSVITAGNGEEALQRLKDHKIDLVLSDIMMPVMDGVALLQAIKNTPATARLPVILLSARAGEEARMEGLDTGADDYLVKPFSVKELLARVRSHVLAHRKIEESEARLRKLAKTLERKVEERTAELSRSNDDLQQFAHVASHDLKEPVRKIMTFAQLLESSDGAGLSERGRTSLGKIYRAADRMMNMVNGVLAYSKLAATDQTDDTVDLAAVIASAETDLEVLIQQMDARIIVGKLPVIKGAPVLIRQLFYNLLNNALKFSKAGVSPQITISSQDSGDGKVKIIVADNGIGFEQEYAGRIFKSFARLNSKDSYEGTGLGLSLCRKIAERHGGTITAQGQLNVGATFTVTLPL